MSLSGAAVPAESSDGLASGFGAGDDCAGGGDFGSAGCAEEQPTKQQTRATLMPRWGWIFIRSTVAGKVKATLSCHSPTALTPRS